MNRLLGASPTNSLGDYHGTWSVWFEGGKAHVEFEAKAQRPEPLIQAGTGDAIDSRAAVLRDSFAWAPIFATPTLR